MLARNSVSMYYMGSMKTTLQTAKDTILFGKSLASTLSGGAILCLHGNLGAGKTTFCRWLALVVASGAIPAHPVGVTEEFEEKLPDGAARAVSAAVPLARMGRSRGMLARQRSLDPHRIGRQLKPMARKNQTGWADLGRFPR